MVVSQSLSPNRRKELEAREARLAQKIVDGRALLADRKRRKSQALRNDAQDEIYGDGPADGQVRGSDDDDNDDDADAESALTGPGESLNDRDALVASDGVVHMLAHKLGISSLHVAQSGGNVRLVRDAEAREILEEATEHPEVAPLPPSGLPFTRQSIHSM